MHFEHTEERRLLADSLARFIHHEYGFAVRDRIAGSAAGWDAALWQRFADLGAVGALLPESAGGLGGSGFDIAVVFEALGRGLVVEPFLGALMAGTVLAAAGGAAGQDGLAELVAGHRCLALVHDAPGGDFEPACPGVQAVAQGAGWRLSGMAAGVPQGEAADAFVVSASAAGGGISLFLVPADMPGLQLRGAAAIDGGRVADLWFDGAVLPAEALLGEPGAGMPLLQAALDRGTLALCAESLGAMDAAREATLDYLRTRRQFGVPIGSFQALQHRMADVLLEIEQARSAVINAAAAIDAPQRAPAARSRAVSAAKHSIGRIGIRVAEECIQLHGGIGMTWELPLAHHAKRLVMIDHQLGDEDWHLQRYIALGAAAEAEAEAPGEPGRASP